MEFELIPDSWGEGVAGAMTITEMLVSMHSNEISVLSEHGNYQMWHHSDITMPVFDGIPEEPRLESFLTFTPSVPSIPWNEETKEVGVIAVTLGWTTVDGGPIGSPPVQQFLKRSENNLSATSIQLYSGPALFTEVGSYIGYDLFHAIWGPEDVARDVIYNGAPYTKEVWWGITVNQIVGGWFPTSIPTAEFRNSTIELLCIGGGMAASWDLYGSNQSDWLINKDTTTAQKWAIFGRGAYRAALSNYRVHDKIWFAGDHVSSSGDITSWDTNNYGTLDADGRFTGSGRTIVFVARALFDHVDYGLSSEGKLYILDRSTSATDDVFVVTFIRDVVTADFLLDCIYVNFTPAVQFIVVVREIIERLIPKLVVEYICLVDDEVPVKRVHTIDAVVDAYNGAETTWVASTGSGPDRSMSWNTACSGLASSYVVSTYTPGSSAWNGDHTERYTGSTEVAPESIYFALGWGGPHDYDGLPWWVPLHPGFGRTVELIRGDSRPSWLRSYENSVMVQSYTILDHTFESHYDFGGSYKDIGSSWSLSRQGSLVEGVSSSSNGISILIKQVDALFTVRKDENRISAVFWNYQAYEYFAPTSYKGSIGPFFRLGGRHYTNATSIESSSTYEENCSFSTLVFEAPRGEVDEFNQVTWTFPGPVSRESSIPDTSFNFECSELIDRAYSASNDLAGYTSEATQIHSTHTVGGSFVEVIATDPEADVHNTVLHTLSKSYKGADVIPDWRIGPVLFEQLKGVGPTYRVDTNPTYKAGTLIPPAGLPATDAMLGHTSFSFEAQPTLYMFGGAVSMGDSIIHKGSFDTVKSGMREHYGTARALAKDLDPLPKPREFLTGSEIWPDVPDKTKYHGHLGISISFPRAFFNSVAIDFRFIPSAFVEACLAPGKKGH